MIFIVSLLCVIVIAAGFSVLHFALFHNTVELKVAGWSLVIGGVVNLFCVFYFAPPRPELILDSSPQVMYRHHEGHGNGYMERPRKQCPRLHKQQQDAIQKP